MSNTSGSGYEDYLADCTTNVFSLVSKMLTLFERQSNSNAHLLPLLSAIFL